MIDDDILHDDQYAATALIIYSMYRPERLIET